jgi:ATP phosphoribosyltransferase
LGDVLKFLIRHDVGVLNVAGHRESLLDCNGASWIGLVLDRILQAWGAAYAVNHPSQNLPALLGCAASAPKVFDQRLPTRIASRAEFVLAIPSSGSMRRVTAFRLGIKDDEDFVTRARSRVEVPRLSCEIVYGRARDMAQWLNDQRVDAVIGGLDELLEGGAAGRLIYDFGLFRSSLCLIGRRNLHRRQSAKSVVLSQVPNLAQRLLEQQGERTLKVVPIYGRAESWLHLGYGDECIDTIHSGSSARANGLEPYAVLGETSLCLIAHDNLTSGKGEVLQTIVQHLSIPVQ